MIEGAALGNENAAETLEEVGRLLEDHGANPFRIRAYRRAGARLRALDRPLSEILEQEGLEGLRSLPDLGESLARAVAEVIQTGRLGLLERLRGEGAPERILTSVPGIGRSLARRIHEELGIESLGELQAAAWDGRLSTIAGMGGSRVQAVRESLAGRFRLGMPKTLAARDGASGGATRPPVAELLDVDREYHAKARRRKLPRVAPRRFNPTREAWLPVLHTERGERHYTALFSNTARAHEMGTTRDWVVIFRDDRDADGCWTVITGRLGALRGKRIVRGREAECREHYESERGELFPDQPCASGDLGEPDGIG